MNTISPAEIILALDENACWSKREITDEGLSITPSGKTKITDIETFLARNYPALAVSRKGITFYVVC